MNIKSLLKYALILSLSVLFASPEAMAQGTTRAKKKDGEEAANQIDQQTGTVMTKALEFFNAMKYADARAKLGELKMDKLSPYEKSRVEQIFYQMDALEEKWDSARKHMEAAIASGGFTDKEISDARYQLAQMFVQQEKWKEGAAAIEDWLKTATNPNGSVYYLLAVCYYSLDNVDAALPNIKKAVDSSEKLNENWTAMYAQLLMAKERYKEALPQMMSLLNAFPSKKQYWMNVSSVYQSLDDNKNALIVVQLAMHAGIQFEGAELQRFAELLAIQELPYSAGVVLEKAMTDKKLPTDQKMLQKLASNYAAAAEYKKAIATLEKAQQLSENGPDYQRIGEYNMNLFQWGGAQAALEKALNKGGLRDATFVQFYIGYCQFNQKKYTEAKATMEKIPANHNLAKNAKSYIQLINSKIR